MGLFPEYEVTIEVRNPLDNNSNDTITYPTLASLTFKGHIIQSRISEINILNEEIADLEVNPTGDYSATIKKNAKLSVNGNDYKVVNNPEDSYKRLMNVTKLQIRKVNNV